MHLFLSNFIGPDHQTNVLTFTNSNLSNHIESDRWKRTYDNNQNVL